MSRDTAMIKDGLFRITEDKAIIILMEKIDYWRPFKHQGKIYFKTFKYNIIYFEPK